MLITTKIGKKIEFENGDKFSYNDNQETRVGVINSENVYNIDDESFIVAKDIDNETIVVLISEIIDKIIEQIKPTLKKIILSFILELLGKMKL